MSVLEPWRKELGHFLDDSGGNPYSPSRSWQALTVAYKEGRLLDYMTDWLDDYSSLSTHDSAEAMVQIVKSGQRTWEHILLAPNRPWTPYVSDSQRAKLLQCIRDCCDRAAREMEQRVKAASLLTGQSPGAASPSS